MRLNILSRSGSDHAPMLLSCGGKFQHFNKSFIFLKFWAENEEFKEAVLQN